jgi:uncharacterized membrane protein
LRHNYQSLQGEQTMTRIVNGSRRIALGVAFVGVMAGAGGLAGAIGGVLLVLMSQAVLGMSAGLVELLPVSVVLGVLASIFFGVFLMARHTVSLAWQPRLVSSRSKSE